MKTHDGDDVLTIDDAALRSVALDYLEGWFEGDAVRMERALHPELMKRSLETLPDGGQSLETLRAEQMIGWTEDGIGKTRDVPERSIHIAVGHVYGDIATVTVTSAVYIEYLHLVRTLTPGNTTLACRLLSLLFDLSRPSRALRIARVQRPTVYLRLSRSRPRSRPFTFTSAGSGSRQTTDQDFHSNRGLG